MLTALQRYERQIPIIVTRPADRAPNEAPTKTNPFTVIGKRGNDYIGSSRSWSNRNGDRGGGNSSKYLGWYFQGFRHS